MGEGQGDDNQWVEEKWTMGQGAEGPGAECQEAEGRESEGQGADDLEVKGGGGRLRKGIVFVTILMMITRTHTHS